MVQYKIEDGVEYCYCKNCEQVHLCADHFMNRRNKHGYSLSCKATTKNYYKEPAIPQEIVVKAEAERILKQLGFDPTSKIPVYEQFLIKHDL